MKKWILLILALFLLISIASIGIGCKGKEAPKPAAEEVAKPAEAPSPPAAEQAKPAEAPKPATEEKAKPGEVLPPALSFDPSKPVKQ